MFKKYIKYKKKYLKLKKLIGSSERKIVPKKINIRNLYHFSHQNKVKINISSEYYKLFKILKDNIKYFDIGYDGSYDCDEENGIVNMPSGPGTYGKQKGRPPKQGKKK